MKTKTMSAASALLFFLIAAMLPLYITKTGYSHLGTDKYILFFYGCTFLFGILTLLAILFLFAHLIQEKSLLSYDTVFSSLSLTDIFAIGYFLAVTVSYYFSPFPDTALWGNNEWFMGLLSQYGFILIYFFISHFFTYYRGSVAIMLVVSTFISILGIVNRFGWYPIYIFGSSPKFISTIGNINWFCGYLIIMTGLMIMLFYQSSRLTNQLIYGFCLFINFLGIITQGSMSGYAATALLLFILLGKAVKSKKTLEKFLMICLLLFASCTCTYISCYFFPNTYVMQETAVNYIAFSILPCICLFVTAIFYVVLKFRVQACNLTRLYWGLCISAVLACIITTILIIKNTLHPGSIGALSNLSFFTFDAAWGSTRGGTWMVGIDVYASLPFWRKLIGIGSDCFLAYTYSILSHIPALEHFQKPMLANAHNELLTTLVNTGFFGFITYSGLFFSSINRYIRSKGTLQKAIAFAIMAYMINNFFSFQQVISTSLIFLLLGVGEGLMRGNEDK